MSSLFSLFTRPAASKITDEQLYDAQIKLAEHAAAAEHHAALAEMYRKRIARLNEVATPDFLRSAPAKTAMRLTPSEVDAIIYPVVSKAA